MVGLVTCVTVEWESRKCGGDPGMNDNMEVQVGCERWRTASPRVPSLWAGPRGTSLLCLGGIAGQIIESSGRWRGRAPRGSPGPRWWTLPDRSVKSGLVGESALPAVSGVVTVSGEAGPGPVRTGRCDAVADDVVV